MSNQDFDNRVKVTILSTKDLEFSYYCGPGNGGQKKNKTASGVMIRHEESGAIARAHDSRSQDANKRSAFEKLVKDPRMKFWLAKRIFEVKQGEKLEEIVERDMNVKNLKFEIKVDGKWREVGDDYFKNV